MNWGVIGLIVAIVALVAVIAIVLLYFFYIKSKMGMSTAQQTAQNGYNTAAATAINGVINALSHATGITWAATYPVPAAISTPTALPAT